MTDDPLDLTKVAADEAAIEQLRLRAVPPEDSALQLLRDLLLDLDAEAATERPPLVPVGRGSTVLRLAGETTPDPRAARGGTVVAVLAAGMVLFGGVAAASTAVAPDNPLHGLGETVRSAAGAVVDAVKPPSTVRRADPAEGALPAPASSRATEAISSRPSVPVVPDRAVAARSDAAVRAVTALLDQAQALLDEGRPAVAEQRLDVAERRLAEVTGDAVAGLQARLDQLRSRLPGAAEAPRTGPATPGKAEQRPEPRHAPKAEQKTEQKTGPRENEPRAEQPARPAEPAGVEGRSFPRQPSRLASTKPRA